MNKTRCFVALAALIAALTACSAFLWAPAAAQDKDKVVRPPAKWEYKVIVIGVRDNRIDDANMEENLNKLGSDGWDCVGTVSEVTGGTANFSNRTRGILICKRPKQ